MSNSDPLRACHAEHLLIERVLDAVERAEAEPLGFFRGAVEFFARFVDRHHHAEEERRLFPLAASASDLLAELREGHLRTRVAVARMRERIIDPDPPGLQREIAAFGRLLRNQMRGEEKRLWPLLAGQAIEWPGRPDAEALADALLVRMPSNQGDVAPP